MYGIRRYDGIPGIQYSKSLYGVELIDVLKIKASTLLHQVIYTQKPYYFFNRIQFARSNRGKQIIIYKYNTAVELVTKPIINHWQCFAI